MNVKCIIIDDEPLAIKVIEQFLNEFDDFEIVATFNDPISAISTIETSMLDVVFLDINMSKMNGLDFLKNFDVRPNIVITTAYREYAIESYTLDVLDYLVKPIAFNRFLKTVNKITKSINSSTSLRSDLVKDSYIFLKVNKKLVKIFYKEILYIESLKDYIKVFTLTDDYLVHKSLTSITNELPTGKFIRIHRSFTIAIDKIISIEGNLVEVSKKRIPIGRKYQNHAKKIILNVKN
ncbi:MAG: LytTR family DNA-binding domain-containing protein [Flavobacteriaceae bacterium]